MNPYEIQEVASQVAKLSRDAESQNLEEATDKLLRLAASLELISPELQNCWGGPLNGQEGRRAIFRELLTNIQFDALFETGTYRGLTTAWFADHFSGPIYSCEVDRRYYYQAEVNLKGRANVHICLEDSRNFLRRKLASSSKDGVYFIYLDAHWQDDLPLAEEVRIILQSTRRCVIAIDDFKVPGDTYKYDDYGPGKVISLDLLEEFKNESIRLFFPKLRAAEETGAARGACIIAIGLESEVDACTLLQGNSWENWKARESAHDAAVMDATAPPQDASNELAGSTNSPETPFSREQEMNEIKQGMADLLQSQASLHAIIEAHTLSLREQFEAVDERREMGRNLVEQRAKNLDLERQNYRLSEELQKLSKVTTQSPAPQSPSTISNDIANIKKLVGDLTRSRMINYASTVAPNARRTVQELAARLDKLIEDLNAH